MKQIQHKVYLLEDEDGIEVDLNKITSLNVSVNDKVTELDVTDVFKKFEGYEKNKLVGWSILEFFKFEDGYLVDEDRNKISFYSKELDKELYVKKIRNAIIMLGDLDVKDSYIRNVKKLLVLSKGRITESRQEHIDEVKDEIKNTDNIVEIEVPVEAPVAEVAVEEPKAEPVVEPVVEPVPEVVPEPVAEVPQVTEEPAPQPEPIPAPEPEPIVETPVVETTPQAVAETPQVTEPTPAPEPAPEPEPQQEQPKEEEKELDPDSYEYLAEYYKGIGYKEYVKDNFRLLYKEKDLPYFIKISDDSFEQIHGDLADNTDKKFVYQYEENGEEQKITFDKVLEPVSE